jgi:hypothetical protein
LLLLLLLSFSCLRVRGGALYILVVCCWYVLEAPLLQNAAVEVVMIHDVKIVIRSILFYPLHRSFVAVVAFDAFAAAVASTVVEIRLY